MAEHYRNTDGLNRPFPVPRTSNTPIDRINSLFRSDACGCNIRREIRREINIISGRTRLAGYFAHHATPRGFTRPNGGIYTAFIGLRQEGRQSQSHCLPRLIKSGQATLVCVVYRADIEKFDACNKTIPVFYFSL